jgi:folate-dependent tRNA-U54 methylase TrmFO/GidA
LSYKKQAYKISLSQTFKERTTRTSIKAGKVSGIPTLKKTVSASGALTRAELKKKIKEVERTKADLFTDKWLKP